MHEGKGVNFLYMEEKEDRPFRRNKDDMNEIFGYKNSNLHCIT